MTSIEAYIQCYDFLYKLNVYTCFDRATTFERTGAISNVGFTTLIRVRMEIRWVGLS